MRLWSWKKEDLLSVAYAARTAVAATFSVLLAQLLRLPEPSWAAIATVFVMQSGPGSTLPLAVERIVASALGALIGAIESTFFGRNLVAFGIAVFLLGLASFAFRVRRMGYHYASITLAIVVLIPHGESEIAVCV